MGLVDDARQALCFLVYVLVLQTRTKLWDRARKYAGMHVCTCIGSKSSGAIKK